MYGKYKVFSCFVLFCISELQFEFTVVGFLCSILPRRSLGTHRYKNMMYLEKCHNRFTRIFWSLIWMEIFWYDSSSFYYSIVNSTEYEFFCMRVTYRISNNLFSEVIKDCSKVEVDSLVDDVGKITSPNNIGMNGANRFEMVHNFNSSNIFPMHLILLLITRLNEFLSFLHESRYAKFLHESSCFWHWPIKTPSDTSMSIPRMFIMNRIKFLFFILIPHVHLGTMLKWWPSNRKYTRKNTISYTMCGMIMIFFVYLSHEIGLLHLFFWFAQQQCWAIR